MHFFNSKNANSVIIDEGMVLLDGFGENDTLMASIMQQGTPDTVHVIHVSMAVSFLALLFWCVIFGVHQSMVQKTFRFGLWLSMLPFSWSTPYSILSLLAPTLNLQLLLCECIHKPCLF